MGETEVSSKVDGVEKMSNGMHNGISNGSSSSHKHKHKDKDREREKDKHKSSHKDKDRDKDHHSSHKSSHKDKDRHSSHKSSHKDKDREREKDKNREKDKDREKHKSKDRDKERSEKHSLDKDKHKSEKHSSDKDKHKSDKHRDDKSRSSSKHKSDKHSSDRDKHRSSDKDKHRSDKHKKSSSDKDRERHHKSSHKDKEHDKERSKDSHRHSEVKEEVEEKVKIKEEIIEASPQIKEEPEPVINSAESSDEQVVKEEFLESEEDENQLVIKEEESVSDDDFLNSRVKKEEEDSDKEYDQPLTSRKKPKVEESDDEYSPAPRKSKIKKAESDDDDEYSPAPKKSKIKKAESDDDDEYSPAPKKRKIKKAESDDDDEYSPGPKKSKIKKAESDGDFEPSPKRFKVKKEESEEDDDFKPSPKRKIKKESDDDEDFKPSKKRALSESDDDDDVPLIARKKMKKEKAKPKAKKTPKSVPKKKSVKSAPEETASPKKKKKSEEEENVWKWWEEKKSDDGRKWKFLEHKGPVFADLYEPLPDSVKFYYDGEQLKLSAPAEEVAGFYARMLGHDYTTKEVFNTNFFKDWRKSMDSDERTLIQGIAKCNFKPMYEYYTMKNEERKNRTKEEKKALKEKNEAIVKEYGWCLIDSHKQKIGNFKIEPPGLFRGRGDHPKQGMMKRRTMPEDVIINCSRDSKIPVPPEGHKWKEVRHDPNVTWLCSWTENVQNQVKYVMLNAASKLKGEKDWQKYETARKLHKIVDQIRENYKNDFKSKEMRVRQRAVALYFIDKLALRAGNEKDEDQADTVGCCSLRVEHISLHEEKGGKEFVVVFDFLGKDSIRYYNEVPVEKRVFKNLTLFMENKQDGDDLFDRLNTQIMNKHLNELMEGLTAKVFRTYNASRTLQEQLDKLTDPDDSIPHKILSYNRANREVAILCNHQRAVPKTFDKSMANLQKKIDDKKEFLDEEMKNLKALKKEAKNGSAKDKTAYEKKKKTVERIDDQLKKLEISATDKEENKQIALGTSKLNYLDPRISVAWCKRNGVPVEKVYNKTQRMKFQWAIDMATADYNFMAEPMNITKNSQDDENEEENEEEDEEE